MNWSISTTEHPEKAYHAFCASWELSGASDLSALAKKVSDGTVVCSPNLVLGWKHLDLLLTQAISCWERGLLFARRRSIDLLMRLTCRAQIDDATAASGIRDADRVAAFGIAPVEADLQTEMNKIQEYLGSGAVRRDELLESNQDKVARYLNYFETCFPRSLLQTDQADIVPLLIERASLLLLSK